MKNFKFFIIIFCCLCLVAGSFFVGFQLPNWASSQVEQPTPEDPGETPEEPGETPDDPEPDSELTSLDDFSIEDGTILKYLGTEKDIAIPSSYSVLNGQIVEGNDILIKSIGNHAFYDSSIESIVLPKYLTEIGNFAFSCSQLKSIEIPSSVQIIKQEAFANCENLESFTLETENLIYFDMNTFLGCDSLPLYEYNNVFYKGMEDKPYLIASDVISSIKDIELADSCIVAERDFFYNSREPDSIILSPNFIGFYDPEFLFPSTISDEGLKQMEYENGYYLGSKENPYMVLVGIVDITVDSFSIHKDCETILLSHPKHSNPTYQNIRSLTIPASVEFIGYCGLKGFVNLEELIFEDGSNLRVYHQSMIARAENLSLQDIDFPNGAIMI